MVVQQQGRAFVAGREKAEENPKVMKRVCEKIRFKRREKGSKTKKERKK